MAKKIKNLFINVQSENQYRCTIIRGKAQKDLDNLLPAYANLINDVCPTDKTNFDNHSNDYLSNIFMNQTSLIYQKIAENN